MQGRPWRTGALIFAAVGFAGCSGDAPSEPVQRSAGQTHLQLECTPASVIRLQEVVCAIRGGGNNLEVRRWVFTNDEGRDLPPIERWGEDRGDTVWAGPVAVGGVVQADVRMAGVDFQLLAHFQVLPGW